VRELSHGKYGEWFHVPPGYPAFAEPAERHPRPPLGTEVETAVLGSMNQALATLQGASVERVTQIFGDADQQYLLTLSELDHYHSCRNNDLQRIAEYWQPLGRLPGQKCDWPAGQIASQEKPHLFIYLRGEAPIAPILQGLAHKRYPTICYAPHLPAEECSHFKGTSVLVSPHPVDLQPILQSCDAALLHGGYVTVSEFLRAGVPMLVLPLNLEQRVTGERLEELGVGYGAPIDDLNLIASLLEDLLENDAYREAAGHIAVRYRYFNHRQATSLLVENVERTLQEV